MIKALIFDCFGVLTEDGWLAFCNKYRTAKNGEELRYINHQADKGLVSYEEFLNTVCELTGAPREEAHSTITTTHHPNVTLFECIKRLKSAGYHLSIISNVGDSLYSFLPKEYVDLFEEITLSYHVHAIKPDPKIYEYHLEKIGFQPEECVFVDDRQPNVVGAEKVGVKGVQFQDSSTLIAEFEHLGIQI